MDDPTKENTPGPELPAFDSHHQDEQNSRGPYEDSKQTVFSFEKPIQEPLSSLLIHAFLSQSFPSLEKQYPGISFSPIYDDYNKLVGIDFQYPLNDELREHLKKEFEFELSQILSTHKNLSPEHSPFSLGYSSRGSSFGTSPYSKRFSRKNSKRNNDVGPISFTEMLGTFRVRLVHFYYPILFAIFFATVFAWLSVEKAGIVVNAAMVDPNESSVTGILLNGLVPVLISAAFITLIWLGVKKFGINLFKVLMGVIVFLYTWWGFLFFVDVFFIVYWEKMVEISALFFAILYYFLIIGSFVYLLRLAYLFFKNKLELLYRNGLVLSFSIFVGALLGASLPTWTTFAFAFFLSIWDIIAVFKGPLGNIANMISENRKKYVELIEEKVRNGEIPEDQAPTYLNLDTVDTDLSKYLKEIEIELGSGDLILYSALVSHTFVHTQQWLTTILVIIGILVGAFLTLYFLIKKRRVLPALPFSMLFGIIMFFVGQWLVSL